VRIWDLPNYQPLHRLTGRGSAVDRVALTADGRLAASIDRQWTIRVWDPRSGEEVARLQAGWLGRGFCAGICFTSDGQQVIVGQGDGTFQAWDFEADDLRAISRVEDGNGDLRMSALAITPDAQLAVTGSRDGAVRVWDLQRGTRLHSFTDHSVVIWSVAVTADGRRALSGSADGTCRLWDPVAGIAVATLGEQGHGVQAVAVTPDGTWACVARTDNTVTLWHLPESRPVARFTTDNPIHYATCAVVAAEAVLILAGETSGRMHILELKA
jgi:WD40 repeat protein